MSPFDAEKTMRLPALIVAGTLVGGVIGSPGCRRAAPSRQNAAAVPSMALHQPAPGTSQQQQPAAADNGPVTKADIDALDARADAVAHIVGALPPLADLDAAGQAFHTPEAAFQFVRDRIANEPYAGVQKGAWGTLATRGGNDVDKALLLAALLTAQSVDVQLAHGTIDAATGQRLAGEPLAHPDAVTLSLGALKVAASAVALAPDEQDVSARFDAAVTARRSAIRAAVDQAYGILAPSAPQAPATPAAPADHYFVQASIDGKTVVFDPTLAANAPGTTLVTASETLSPDSVPADGYQTIQFTVVAAYLDGGKLSQTIALDKTVRAVDLIGKPLRMVIATQDGGASANAFRAQLLVNDDRTDGDIFQLHQGSGGEESGGGVGGLGGMFGGLGGGAPAPSQKAASGPPLARLWLDVTESAPGQPPFKVRRVILDRLDIQGTALAAGQSDALARQLLLQVWDGAADAGAFVAPFVFQTEAAAMKNTATAAGVAYAANEKHDAVNVGDLPGPTLSSAIVSLLFTSDLARHAIARGLGAQVRSWYQVPRLAFLRRGVRIADWQSSSPKAVYAEDTDLFEPLLAFAGPSGSVRELALRAGITDTALEARIGSTLARPGTLAVFAAMPAGSSRHYTGANGLPSVPSGAVMRAVREDASSQAGVVAPSSFVSVAGAPRFGWWTFAGGTPYALGKMELGGGQDLAEQKELQEIPNKIKPFIQFDGNITRCFVAGAISGLPGDAAQDQMTECMVSAVCDLVADLVADKVGESAEEGVVDEEMIQELQSIMKGMIAADLKLYSVKDNLAKGCEDKVGGALK